MPASMARRVAGGAGGADASSAGPLSALPRPGRSQSQEVPSGAVRPPLPSGCQAAARPERWRRLGAQEGPSPRARPPVHPLGDPASSPRARWKFANFLRGFGPHRREVGDAGEGSWLAVSAAAAAATTA